MAISTAQIRGARGVLNWSQADLSERTGISATSIGSIENGQTAPRERTLLTIQKAFEDGGIEFLGTSGVQMRSTDIKIYKGRAEFWEFYNDIYDTVKDSGGEILVSNVDERDFKRLLSEENIEIHKKRMREVDDLTLKILICDGDNFELAASDYSHYKKVPKEFFGSVPFYVYGPKLAFILFNAEPTVIVLDYPGIAEAYSIQFDMLWKIAKD